MNCEEVQFIIGRYVDGELGREDMIGVEEHAYNCPRCAETIKLMHREADLLKAALSADVEPQFDENLWPRLNRTRKLKTFFIRTALAAAACIMAAIIFQGVPGREEIRLARVISCSGPLQINSGSGWKRIETYSIINDGDKLRCGAETPGGIILNANRRIDIDTDSEITFFADVPGSFRLEVARGRLHGEFVNLPEPVIITTPLGSIAIRSEYILGGRAEFELELMGGDEQTVLDFLDPIKPAYAASELTLQVFVYEGTATVTNAAGQQVEVQEREKIFVKPQGTISAPIEIEPSDRLAWWPMPGTRHIVARAAEPEPVVFEDKAKAVAVSAAMPGPPPPTDVAAVPDMDAVLVTWRPVTGSPKKIEEYVIYRRAPGETEFSFAGRFPAVERIEKYIFAHDGVPVGAEYEYAVAAAWKDEMGGLTEGQKSEVITGVPGDFDISLSGGNAASAVITVEKFTRTSSSKKAFNVRPRNLSRAETGDIGESKGIGDDKETADFSTGYHLVEIITGKDGRAEKIIIENGFGIRREIEKVIN